MQWSANVRIRLSGIASAYILVIASPLLISLILLELQIREDLTSMSRIKTASGVIDESALQSRPPELAVNAATPPSIEQSTSLSGIPTPSTRNRASFGQSDAITPARRLQALILLALAGIVLATRALARLNRTLSQIAEKADGLSRGMYDMPVNVSSPIELAELASNLDWLRQRLGDLEEDQDRFLRNVSHEFKTPLSSIIQGLDILEKGKTGALTPAQLEVVEILGECVEELKQLISNLLAYARWKSERPKAGVSEFSIEDLVQEVISPRKLLLASHDLSVHLNFAAANFLGDRGLLKEALENLVSNAIKYTSRGTGIEIEANVADGLQTLAVRDFGNGVKVKDQRRVFDPFFRGEDSVLAGLRGTGVGLTIVRETAHAHAGRVEIRNVNPGAKFVLTWPLPTKTL